MMPCKKDDQLAVTGIDKPVREAEPRIGETLERCDHHGEGLVVMEHGRDRTDQDLFPRLVDETDPGQCDHAHVP